jgi:hypothetical protein
MTRDSGVQYVIVSDNIYTCASNIFFEKPHKDRLVTFILVEYIFMKHKIDDLNILYEPFLIWVYIGHFG